MESAPKRPHGEVAMSPKSTQSWLQKQPTLIGTFTDTTNLDGAAGVHYDAPTRRAIVVSKAADSLAVARRQTDRAADVALFTRLTGLGSGAAEMYLEGGRSVEGAVRAAIQGLHAPGAVNNADVVEEGGRYTVRAPTIDRASSAGAPPAAAEALEAAAQEAVDAAVLARVMEGSDSEEY